MARELYKALSKIDALESGTAFQKDAGQRGHRDGRLYSRDVLQEAFGACLYRKNGEIPVSPEASELPVRTARTGLMKLNSETKGEQIMKLDLGILAGSEAWLQGFVNENDRLEKLVEKLEALTTTMKAAVVEELKVDDVDAEEELEPVKAKRGRKAKVAAKTLEEDEEIEEETAAVTLDDDDDLEAGEETKDETVEEPDEDDFTAPPVKSKKKKAVTLDDVNDACKALCGVKGRPFVLGILKKKFKVESIASLKPEQFQACIDAVAVDQ